MKMNIIPRGTKKVQMCFDDKEHMTAVCDYEVQITGNTYPQRGFLKNHSCTWNPDSKCWHKFLDTEADVEELCCLVNQRNLKVNIRPIYRIVDDEYNPINW